MARVQPAASKAPAIVDHRQEALTELNELTPKAIEVIRRHLTGGVAEHEIAAARVVLERVRAPEAAYSFIGHISNQTNLTLTRKSKDINGHWDTEPPETIAPGGSPEFKATYDGFEFKGTIVYEANGGEFEMKWKMPLIGYNTIHASTTIGGTKARHEGGRGWDAEVWYYLEVA